MMRMVSKRLLVSTRLMLAAAPLLLAASCIFTPLHGERRQTTKWAFDMLFCEPGETEGPGAVKVGTFVTNLVVSPIVLPGSWIWDAFVVNPFDSCFDSSADVYDVVWNRHPETQEVYEDRSDYDGEYSRSEHGFTRPLRHFTGVLVFFGDFLVRANIPVGPRGFGRFYDVKSAEEVGRGAAKPWYFDKPGYQPREVGSGKNIFWVRDQRDAE